MTPDAGTGAAAAQGEPPAGVVLRRASLSDADAIARLELQLFPEEAWSLAQIAAEIDHPARHYAVAVDDAAAPADGRSGPLIGYAGIMVAGETADLHTIGTTAPGRGVGRALLSWCEQQASAAGAQRMLLEVREDNARARAVYSRAGYQEIAVRRGYYRLPGRTVDAIIMERALHP